MVVFFVVGILVLAITGSLFWAVVIGLVAWVLTKK